MENETEKILEKYGRIIDTHSNKLVEQSRQIAELKLMLSSLTTTKNLGDDQAIKLVAAKGRRIEIKIQTFDEHGQPWWDVYVWKNQWTKDNGDMRMALGMSSLSEAVLKADSCFSQLNE